MKCPNCGFPMKYKYYDNVHGQIVEYYSCHMCNILYNCSTRSWEIPSKYERITDNQQKAIDFINAMCSTNFNPQLKNEATRIIKKHIERASDIAENIKYNTMCSFVEDELFPSCGYEFANIFFND